MMVMVMVTLFRGRIMTAALGETCGTQELVADRRRFGWLEDQRRPTPEVRSGRERRRKTRGGRDAQGDAGKMETL